MAQETLAARKKLIELEMRVPWTCVKKSWGARRQAWLASVQNTSDCEALAKQLLKFEYALKQEALTSHWSKEGWRARLSAGHLSAEALEQALDELERAIDWGRLTLGPQSSGTAIPSELGETLDSPPEGLPHSAVRMLVLLREMGCRSHEPSVVLQLLELMHAYTEDVLKDAASFARFRAVSAASIRERDEANWQRAAPGRTPHAQAAGSEAAAAAPIPADGAIEVADVELAVKTCTRRSFVSPPSREALAQSSIEVNVQPLPLMPKTSALLLPDGCGDAARSSGDAEMENGPGSSQAMISLDDEDVRYCW